MKRLYRSEKNKVWGGVVGGLGEYFEVDPVLLRLFWVIFVIVTGIIPGLVCYLVALALVPHRPHA